MDKDELKSEFSWLYVILVLSIAFQAYGFYSLRKQVESFEATMLCIELKRVGGESPLCKNFNYTRVPQPQNHKTGII